MSLHIDRDIEKIKNRRNQKPKHNKPKKQRPIYLYPCETVVFTKNNSFTRKRKILSEKRQWAEYEFKFWLEKVNGWYDYDVPSIPEQTGNPVDIIAQDAGINITSAFLPFIKAKEKEAAKQQIKDERAAKLSAGIDRARDGLAGIEINKKLETAKNKSKHYI